MQSLKSGLDVIRGSEGSGLTGEDGSHWRILGDEVV